MEWHNNMTRAQTDRFVKKTGKLFHKLYNNNRKKTGRSSFPTFIPQQHDESCVCHDMVDESDVKALSPTFLNNRRKKNDERCTRHDMLDDNDV